MSKAPNTITLPETMKKPGLAPAPERPGCLRWLPAALLALSYGLWLLACLFFQPYPECCGAWIPAGPLTLPLMMSSALALLLTLALAAVGAVSGAARERNLWVLLSGLVSPGVALLMFVMLN